MPAAAQARTQVSPIKLANNSTSPGNVRDESPLACKGRRAMRTLSIAVVAVLGLAIGATLMSRPAATWLAAGDDVHQPSIMIDQTANAKNLPVQSFDAF
jgi:hypothetical protein